MVDALPPELRSLVVEAAEGNPFFVEELVATLVDRGVLARANGSWEARALPEGFAVPDTIQALLSARIDLLSAAEKAALQAASVIGRVFWSGPVYELLEGLTPDLRVLEEREFVRRRPGSSLPGETEFAIKHALTREVAYASLPKARRAHLHAAFARWLEGVGEGRAEHAALLAHHYAEAVRPQDADLAWGGQEDRLEELRGSARAWLRRAAALAVAQYALDDAVALLGRALELEDEPHGQAELWHALGVAHALKFDGEPFRAAMERAIELTDEPLAQADLYADLAMQTAARAGMWRRLPELALVDGWVDRAIELAVPGSAAHVKAALARTMWQRSSDPARSARAAAEASVLAERLGDVELRSAARVTRVLTDILLGDYDGALVWAERCFELRDELKDPDLVCDVYMAGSLASAARGRFGEARRLAELHDGTAVKLTPHHRVHGVAILLEVEELAANWARARELEARVVESVEENLATPCVRSPRSLLVCAVGAEVDGDGPRARALEARARELWMEGFGLALEGPLLRLALIRGDLVEVSRLVDQPAPPRVSNLMNLAAEATRLDGLAELGELSAVEADAVALLGRSSYLEPFAARALGRVRGDEALLRRALDRFEEMGLDWHAEQTRALLQ
jgi:hypothetical protein